MRAIRLSNRQPISLGPQLGGGGEGKIYALLGNPSLVAKVYHPEKLTAAQGDKLKVMYANPPEDASAIAWPIDLLRTPANPQAIGFLMRRVTQVRPLHDIYNPKTRRQQIPFFNYFYLHRTARNLAAAVASIHAKGYVIGDVNESNILVSDRALVTLVDTDSFQVQNPKTGDIYRCPVGKPEFTPPELHGEAFGKVDRTPEHDLFGLAVLIFQLLMEGTHPFDGVYLDPGDPPLKEARIAAGHFPYAHNVPYRPKPFAPPSKILHPKLKQLFWRCFVGGHINPTLRPNACTWVEVLKEAEAELMSCAVNVQHRYSQHLSSCPWCDRAVKLGGRDPFPAKTAVRQSPVTPGKVASPRVTQPTRGTVPPTSVFRQVVTPLKRPLARPPFPKLSALRQFDPIARASKAIPLVVAAGIAALFATVGDWGNFQGQSERGLKIALDRLSLLQARADYDNCLYQAKNLPETAKFTPKVEAIRHQCQLGQAQQLAEAGQFDRAINAITQLPPHLAQTVEVQGFVGQWSRQLLEQAKQEYDVGQLDLAMALMKQIPETSAVAEEVAAIVAKWDREWVANSARLNGAQQALLQGRYTEAKQVATQVTTTYWQQQAQEIVDEAYLQEVEQALDEGQLPEATSAADRIANPQRQQRAKQRIQQVKDLKLAVEKDIDRLDAAFQALAEGRFEVAKQEADRVVSGPNRSAALEIARRAEGYSKIQKLLAAQQWDTASLHTRTQLLKLSGEKVYCEDLRLLDRLWVQHSQGRFGLSVQLRFKENAGILGWDSIPPQLQQPLNRIYPSRPNVGRYGAALDAQLQSCGL